MKSTNSFKSRNKYRKPFSTNDRRSGSNNKQGKKISQLDPERLIRKAAPLSEVPAARFREVDSLPVDERLKARILKKGYVTLTEIQDLTLDPLIAGQDVLGIATTGSGKTAAFLVPVIHQLLTRENTFQTLILVPTRELALQVEQEFKSLTKDLGIYCTCLIGGTNIHKDMDRLKRTNHLIVGTPGRVTDLMNRRVLKLQPFSTLILDEFDRMLDMGFVHDVMRITNEMKNRRQTILFSATINGKQDTLIRGLLHEPKEVKVSSGTTSAEHIEQEIVRIAAGEDKFDILLNMIKQEGFGKVLVFAETKRGVSRLALKLKKSGIQADEIHGDKSQNYRQKALGNFKSGNARVLVATDVAARGIDVDNVTHVINYQIPQDMESYVHRIGRTGRAGKTGKAITLID